MTKTEFLKQGVEDLRSGLQSIFEDPEDEFVGMTKPLLKEFAQENWDDIEEHLSRPPVLSDEVLPGVKAEEVEPPLVPETTHDLETEPSVAESLPTDEDEEEYPQQWEGSPKTNLHTGLPGRKDQRVGTRDLA